jgi:hypothetical protein
MFAITGLEEALELLGQLLAERAQPFEIVAIGGGGLLLIGVIDRPTKDLDLVALVEGDTLIPVDKPLPLALAEAADDVARVLGLPSDWINGGPTSLLRFGLPEGFRDRLEHRVYGGLKISLASRLDQIHFKLFAAADDRPRGKHHVDLEKLKPTHEELVAAARWTKTHDPSEGFAPMVAAVLKAFGVEDEAS